MFIYVKITRSHLKHNFVSKLSLKQTTRLSLPELLCKVKTTSTVIIGLHTQRVTKITGLQL